VIDTGDKFQVRRYQITVNKYWYAYILWVELVIQYPHKQTGLKVSSKIKLSLISLSFIMCSAQRVWRAFWRYFCTSYELLNPATATLYYIYLINCDNCNNCMQKRHLLMKRFQSKRNFKKFDYVHLSPKATNYTALIGGVVK